MWHALLIIGQTGGNRAPVEVEFLAAVFLLTVIAGIWRVFEKAGKPGWAALIPIYNAVVMLDIVGKPIWWLVLFFIPLVNIIASVLVCIELAESFGKSALFGLGIAFLGPIFFPILGFGSARYQPR